jgi:cyclase
VTEHTLIVARLDPRHTEEVARLFGESDAGDLPHLVGVTRRTLYTYNGLYFHHIEADGPVGPKLRELRDQPIFAGLNEALAQYVVPYSPDWRDPRDAMARPFYQWDKGNS